MLFSRRTPQMPTPEQALPGRAQAVSVSDQHAVKGTVLKPPFPQGFEQVVFGMGCFWGAERIFWRLPGVYTTAVGYSGGYTPNPSYEEVCSGGTGHSEVVLVVYDPAQVTFNQLLAVFWQEHDPTQGMRQGNDLGTQYRSTLYTFSDAQLAQARAGAERYQPALSAAGFGAITTEIKPVGEFYYAEDYHQQYLAKNPGGYCGLTNNGVEYPPAAG